MYLVFSPLSQRPEKRKSWLNGKTSLHSIFKLCLESIRTRKLHQQQIVDSGYRVPADCEALLRPIDNHTY